MYLIVITVLIVLIILYFRRQSVEPFQYFVHKNKFKAFEFVPINEKNQKMFTLTVLNDVECKNLCSTTPKCDGYNYFQSDCTLYKNVPEPKDFKVYYRYW